MTDDKHVNLQELKKHMKKIVNLDPQYNMTINDFINIDKNVNRLNYQESHSDTLINKFIKTKLTKLKKDDLIHQLVTTNDKNIFNNVLSDARYKNCMLLNDVLYEICKKDFTS